jgi:hypothetical protein
MQVMVTPVAVVFVLTVVLPHPLVVRVAGDSASTTDHFTVAFDVYQPLFPSVPVIVGVIVGGVESPVTV